MIAAWVEWLYTKIMPKDELEKAEERANELLDIFFEKYDELHRLIHHREDQAEQKKLKKDFADIFYKDEEAQKSLIRLARFINSKAKKYGKRP